MLIATSTAARPDPRVQASTAGGVSSSSCIAPSRSAGSVRRSAMSRAVQLSCRPARAGGGPPDAPRAGPRCRHGGASARRTRRCARRRFVSQTLILEQRRHHVQPKSSDVAVEPEAHDVRYRPLDRRIAPVQVGLLLVISAVIELPPRRDPLPSRAEEAAGPIVRWRAAVAGVGTLECADARRIGRQAIAPDTPARHCIGARRGGFTEPGVAVGRVLEDQVHHHADASRTRCGDQPIEIGNRPELRADTAIVGNVIAEIDLRTGIDRREPDRIDAQPLQIGQAAGNAVEPIPSLFVARNERGYTS